LLKKIYNKTSDMTEKQIVILTFSALMILIIFS